MSSVCWFRIKVAVIAVVLGSSASSAMAQLMDDTSNSEIAEIKRRAEEPGNGSFQALSIPLLDTRTSSNFLARAIQPRIVGGTKVIGAKYPWQAALVDQLSLNPVDGLFCGGVLIASNWIVTAAHCVVATSSNGQTSTVEPSSVNVIVGVSDLTDGVPIPVSAIDVNESYDPVSHRNDIALIRLASPTAVAAASIATNEVLEDSAQPGRKALVSGWGANQEGGDIQQNLLEVVVPIVSPSVCNAPASYSGAVGVSMICAGSPAGAHDACQGDSGGPLMVPASGPPLYVIGLVSWGEGCGRPNKYGVYTLLPPFSSWIAAKIAGG
jgi:transmembrane serine protease 9